MSLLLVLSLLVHAETPKEEGDRLLLERGEIVVRMEAIDARLEELGVPVPDTIAVEPIFRLVQVSPPFKGSDKVSGIVEAKQADFERCWQIGQHPTGIRVAIGEDGDVGGQILVWPAEHNRATPEDPRIKDCYQGVIRTTYGFPAAPLGEPTAHPYTGEVRALPIPYSIEIIFG